jgi:hypothetical protein
MGEEGRNRSQVNEKEWCSKNTSRTRTTIVFRQAAVVVVVVASSTGTIKRPSLRIWSSLTGR